MKVSSHPLKALESFISRIEQRTRKHKTLWVAASPWSLPGAHITGLSFRFGMMNKELTHDISIAFYDDRAVARVSSCQIIEGHIARKLENGEDIREGFHRYPYTDLHGVVRAVVDIVNTFVTAAYLT